MVKLPEYKFKEEIYDGKDTCPIEIMEGEFKGIVYKYGKISIKETDAGDMEVNMDITIIDAPEDFDQQRKEFTQTVGEIFANIVEQNVTAEKEPIDLEDDVHQE
jgi:hypothetical protein